MTLAELQRSDQVRAAKWTHSEQQLVFSEVLGLSLTEQILSAESPLADEKTEQISTLRNDRLPVSLWHISWESVISMA